MEKKRLIGLDIMAAFFLFLGIGATIYTGAKIHKLWTVKPIGSYSASYPIFGISVVFYVSYLLFKRDKLALQIVRWITIVSGFCGLVPLLMYFVLLMNKMLNAGDYWILVISAVFVGLSAIIYFYLTRPKVKEQFR